MSRFNLRKKPRISYYEPEEPNLDEYVYCEDCADFVYEYCSIHGPLLVIPDDKVPTDTSLQVFVPRAALTIPRVFIHIASSIIPGAGLGVFSTLTLPRGVRFGPYRGRCTDEINSMYCWQLYDDNRKPCGVVDGQNPNTSNWMRFVNCARHWREQNLLAYQYRGHIYYRTIKIIPRFTELLVFYGSEYANILHIDLRKYNVPEQYANIITMNSDCYKDINDSSYNTAKESNCNNQLIVDYDLKKNHSP
ncbi:histone-lysine N-methyltransferase PRDM7 [Aphomia sociella]